MKKLLVLGTLLAFCAPVFAQPKCEGNNCPPKRDGKPRQEMKMKKAPKMSEEMQAQLKAAKEQRKARKAQFKANEEKLEKLVKEYKSAKDGSKKQASLRKDIGEVLEQVREEQIAIRAEGLQDFEQRLARMKEGLAKEQEPAAKTAWVEKMTDEIIAEDGDLAEALMSHGRMGPMPRGPMGPQMDGPMLPPPPPGPEGEPAK